MTIREQDIERIVSTAVVAVDTAYGGDIRADSGLHRVVGDAHFTGQPLPSIYSHELARQIRDASMARRNFDDLAKKWLGLPEVAEPPRATRLRSR